MASDDLSHRGPSTFESEARSTLSGNAQVSCNLGVAGATLLLMRTLNDIIPPSRRKDDDSSAKSVGGEPLRLSRRPSRFSYATPAAIILVIIISVVALFYFSTAKVEVTPNSVSAAVQTSLAASANGGALPYQLITAQKVATQSVAASGTRTSNTYASGTITIYNEQAQTQRLITNTRFATSAGLVYRIRSGVTVPGGTAAKPGSVSATVYADKMGSSYNIGPTSFTIPGFAGTPLEDKVYARSTTAMTGGSSGMVPVVEAALEAKTRDALKVALADDLAKSVREQIPAGYVLVPGASATSYQQLTADPSSTTDTVDLKEQGTMTAVVFPNAALASAIASSVAGLGYQGEPMTLASVDGLTLAAGNGLPAPQATTFPFTLAGTVPLVYTVDSARVAAAVSGKSRTDAEVALTNYPEIKRAVITLRPFWRQAFPQDPSSISVVVLEPGD